MLTPPPPKHFSIPPKFQIPRNNHALVLLYPGAYTDQLQSADMQSADVPFFSSLVCCVHLYNWANNHCMMIDACKSTEINNNVNNSDSKCQTLISG